MTSDDTLGKSLHPAATQHGQQLNHRFDGLPCLGHVGQATLRIDKL
jgi:hypothetical protein